MPPPQAEPRNPFYLLLLLSSIVFVFTSLAYAVVPYLEQKAREAGETPPPSPYRAALREDGWRWILWEVVAMMICGVLSMGLDRLRRMEEERRGKESGVRSQKSEEGKQNSQDSP